MSFKSGSGGFARRWEVRQTLLLVSGYLIMACLASRYDRSAFARTLQAFRRLRRRRLEIRFLKVVDRMSTLLQPYVGKLDYEQLCASYHEIMFEDLWGRWREGLRGNWQVQTSVHGLDYLQQALAKGNGVVLWGMSLCGVLVPKIALRREGIWLTQLSAADHGCSYPLTWFGGRIAGPVYCKPESRHIRERVRIPADDNPAYMKVLMRRLADNRCIWISGERMKARHPIKSALLGREALFPTGAPALAHRMNASLLPVHVQWEDRFQYRLVIDEPIETNRDRNRKEWVELAVGEYSRRLQQRVLAQPACWHWESTWVDNLLSSTA